MSSGERDLLFLPNHVEDGGAKFDVFVRKKQHAMMKMYNDVAILETLWKHERNNWIIREELTLVWHEMSQKNGWNMLI